MPGLHVSQILLGYTVASCALAFWKGGRAERIGAALIAADWLLISTAQLLYVRDTQLTLQTIALPALLADIAMCGGFLWLVLRHGDLWLGGALIIQGAQLAVYGSYVASEGADPYTHTLLINLCSFLLLDVLILGALLSWRRRVRKRVPAASVLTASA